MTKREGKKPKRSKSSSDSVEKPPDGPQVEVSGGANIEAEKVEIGGDVVGRDKLVAGGDIVQGDQYQYRAEAGGVVVGAGGQLRQTIVNLPRAVQIGIGAAVLAVIVIAVVLIVAEQGRQSEAAQAAQVNTHFVFDTSQAMADPERLAIARSVLGNEAFLALRREQLGLRVVGGGCEVPIEPRIALGSNQVDQIVAAVNELQPGGDAALVESIKAAADDLPPNAKTNAIIVISAGQDTCLIKQNIDPCTQMSRLAQKLEETDIRFTLNIVALKPDEEARQNLTCLARANINGYFYEANTPEDLQSILNQIEPAEGVPGVANGSFESGQADSWQGEGIEVVTVEDPNTPAVGKYAAQIQPGSALEQSATVPDIDQPQLAVWYRAPGGNASGTLNIYVNDQLAFSDNEPANRSGKLVATEAPDWLVAVVDAEAHRGQTVSLRVEYVSVAGGSGGGLHAPALQSQNVLWIDNVAIMTERMVSALVRPAEEQTPTPTATPTVRATPSRTPRSTATRTPSRTPTRTATAPPLTFTWRTGAFRESGQNAQGIGIWKQEIVVEPAGGVPPYTIVFDYAGGGQQLEGTTFEIEGLFCIGQVGTITVQSAVGQPVRERITVQAPLCPTPTPTPTPSTPPAPSLIQPIANAQLTNFDCFYTPSQDINFAWDTLVAGPGLGGILEVEEIEGEWSFSTNNINFIQQEGSPNYDGVATVTIPFCGQFRWRARTIRNGIAGPFSEYREFLIYTPDA